MIKYRRVGDPTNGREPLVLERKIHQLLLYRSYDGDLWAQEPAYTTPHSTTFVKLRARLLSNFPFRWRDDQVQIVGNYGFDPSLVIEDGFDCSVSLHVKKVVIGADPSLLPGSVGEVEAAAPPDTRQLRGEAPSRRGNTTGPAGSDG